MVKLITFLLFLSLSVTAQERKVRPSIIPQRDSSNPMQYDINSKVFNDGATETVKLFSVRNGNWISFPHTLVMFKGYVGKNSGRIDTILHHVNGNIRSSHVDSLYIKWGNITGKPSLFSGNYNDLTNKPTIPVVNTPTLSNPVRSFNSAFQPSTTRNADVQYSITIAASMSLTGGQSGTVYLETSPNNSTWTLQSQITTANSGTLAVGLNLTNSETKNIRAFVPAGYWVRLRTAGGATITYVTSQEVLL